MLLREERETRKKYFTISYTLYMVLHSNDLFDKFHGLYFYYRRKQTKNKQLNIRVLWQANLISSLAIGIEWPDNTGKYILSLRGIDIREGRKHV